MIRQLSFLSITIGQINATDTINANETGVMLAGSSFSLENCTKELENLLKIAMYTRSNIIYNEIHKGELIDKAVVQSKPIEVSNASLFLFLATKNSKVQLKFEGQTITPKAPINIKFKAKSLVGILQSNGTLRLCKEVTGIVSGVLKCKIGDKDYSKNEDGKEITVEYGTIPIPKTMLLLSEKNTEVTTLKKFIVNKKGTIEKPVIPPQPTSEVGIDPVEEAELKTTEEPRTTDKPEVVEKPEVFEEPMKKVEHDVVEEPKATQEPEINKPKTTEEDIKNEEDVTEVAQEPAKEEDAPSTPEATKTPEIIEESTFGPVPTESTFVNVEVVKPAFKTDPTGVVIETNDLEIGEINYQESIEHVNRVRSGRMVESSATKKGSSLILWLVCGGFVLVIIATALLAYKHRNARRNKAKAINNRI